MNAATLRRISAACHRFLKFLSALKCIKIFLNKGWDLVLYLSGSLTRLLKFGVYLQFYLFFFFVFLQAKTKREAPKCWFALSPVASAKAAVEISPDPSSPMKDWYHCRQKNLHKMFLLKMKVKTLQLYKRRLSKRCNASEN